MTGDGGPTLVTSQRFSNFSLVPFFGWHWPYTSRVHTGISHSGRWKKLVRDYRQQLGPRSDNRLQAQAYQYSHPNPPPSSV